MIRLKVTEEPKVKLKIKDDSIKVTSKVSYEGYSPFDGAYEYTPSSQTQTIAISGKRATSNITINPIPSNYGLITWDGSTLTVS